ncbi:MAG: DUF4097 family beta strand repeat-containing protein, partial [Planctomycetota bacterium]
MTTLDDGSVEITPAWPDAHRRRGETCDLEVILPDTSQLVVRSGNGHVEVSGFSGVVDIETQDGRIKALDMAGPVFATTHDGRIVLSQVPGTMAPASLFSHDGSIKAALAATFEGSLDIDTRDGHISIVNADSLLAESSVSQLSTRHVTMSVGTAPDESVISTRDGLPEITNHEDTGEIHMRLAATTLTALAITTIAGCTFGSARYKETRTINRTSYDAMPLHARSANGGIQVERASTSEGVEIVAHIRARTQERLDEVEIVADDIGNGVFEVYAIWPDDKRRGSEGVSYEIVYPYTEGVTLETSNGSLTIGGFGGDAELRTSNGRITIEGHDGDVFTNTSNGSINLFEITGEVFADTSNGRIQVELTED